MVPFWNELKMIFQEEGIKKILVLATLFIIATSPAQAFDEYYNEFLPGYIAAGASYAVATGSSIYIAGLGFWVLSQDLLFAGTSLRMLACVVTYAPKIFPLLLLGSKVALAVAPVLFVVAGVTVAVMTAAAIAVLLAVYLPKTSRKKHSRKATVSGENKLSFAQALSFDLSSKPDRKVLKEIKRRHSLSKKRMPGGLQGRSYGLTKRQAKRIVPNRTKGFVKTETKEYRGIMEGMESKWKEPRKLKIGYKNKVKI